MTNPFDEPCPIDGTTELRLRWRDHANGTKHIEARCARCGRFMLWLPQTPEAAAEADQYQEAPKQPSLFD